MPSSVKRRYKLDYCKFKRGEGAAETTTTAGWTELTEANAYFVENLRNKHLHPEVTAFSIGTDFQEKVSAKHVKISVSETGPAVAEDNENRMQIMELELLDGEVNVASNVIPTVSDNTLSGIDQWKAANLTDGDYGVSEDRGYSTDIFGKGEQFCKLEQPVTIQFDFENEIQLSGLKFYPRSSKDSVSYGVCANYPKVYTVQASADGVNWNTILENFDQGIVRNDTLYQNMEMSETTFPGTIRAQNAIPGKFSEDFDQYPVSAYTYSGVKGASEYPGGEIEIDQSFDAGSGQNIFGEGLELKKGQTLVVNMGQNLSAVPRIEFSGTEGAKATLHFAEMLNDGSSVGNGATQADGPKGSIYQKSLRGARSTATYVFAGNGKELYQPSMSYFGYQYVQVTASDDITIYSLCSKALSSVTKQTGNIQTNNENVNKLFSNVLFGQMSNYYTTPSDCNQRDERLSWTGDTQAFAQTAVYNFDSTAFLKEMQDIYNENTLIKGYVPGVADNLDGFFQGWAAGWSDVLIIVPWVLYQQTGDSSFLTENWDALVHYMDYMRGKERGENQAPAEGSMNYGDWLSFQGTSVEVMNDYYYGYMHQLMAKIATTIGQTEKAEEYSQKFEAIKEKFLQTHVVFEDGNLTIKSKEGNTGLQFQYGSGKEGVWENNSQTSLIWMLKLGFYDSEEMKKEAEKLLVDNIKNENPSADSVRAKYGKNTLAVGFLGSNVIAPVLSEVGYADVSYDLLLQEQQPSWLFEVLAGATTVWERWNSYTPGTGFGHSEMNSFNHYAYGSILEWMYRYMAGISADERHPGFQNIILQPVPDMGEKYNNQERIHSMDSSYESYYGTIKSSWKCSDKVFTSYHAQIPANTTADLYLPVGEDVAADTNLPEGAVYDGMELHNGLNCAKFKLLSGGYDFKLEGGKVQVSLGEGYQGENAGGGDDNKPVAVTGVQISPTEKELSIGDTLQLKVTILPSNAKNKEVSYHSNDESVAEVSGTGLVTAKKEGEATITVTSKENGKVTAECKITVSKSGGNTDDDNPPIAVRKLKIRPKKKELSVGKTVKLKVNVLPANAKNREVSYHSEDEEIAQVDEAGLVTAKKEGTTFIIVTSKDNSKIKIKCRITVHNEGGNSSIGVKSLEVNPTRKELSVGENLQLKVSILPENAANQEVSYLSSNEGIAKVDANGLVTAKKAGSTTITMTSKENGKVTAECKITVKKPSIKISGASKVASEKSIKLKAITTNIKGTVTWSVSASKYATISKSGTTATLKAKKKVGTVKVTAKIGTIKATKTVKIIIPVKSVQLKKKTKSLAVGETYPLNPTIVPSNATEKEVQFQSSNSKVAMVDAKGKVTAKKQGTTYVTITSKSNKKAKVKCKITVKKPSIKISGASKVEKGKSIRLKVQLKNIKGSVKWSVNNAKLATIKGKGSTATLKAKNKAGTVKVTVKAAGIQKTKNIRITSK